MKVAAYQAPLLPAASLEAVGLIHRRVQWCEAQGVSILCCPEAILGGLADNDPAGAAGFAFDGQGDRLRQVLAPLASDKVTTILGFTETTGTGGLYNSAAILHRGEVIGLYRKRHPAIRRSIYQAGHELPVFQVGDLVFGIVICNDSNHVEPARIMAARGATALFVPTNNGLPPGKTYPGLVADTRKTDVARALENRVWVIRADVAGQAGGLTCDGASAIVDPQGTVVCSAHPCAEDLLVAELRD